MPDFANLFSFLAPLLQQIQQGGSVPGLGQIANQPYTPPFAGGQIPGMPPQQNPYAMLEQILNNLSNQPLAQAPQPGKVQSILEAIGGGLAVAQAKNPGEVLSQQFQGRRQERALREQQLQQRQNMIDNARLQIGVQQATDIAREQAQVRSEQRADLREQAREKRQYDLDIKKLKETGQITADLARSNVLADAEFYRTNRDVLNLKNEDRIYFESLNENERAALIRASRWKTLMPEIEQEYLNDIARVVTGASRRQLSTSERSLYNTVSKKVAEEDRAVFEEEMAGKKQKRLTDAAVEEATRSGMRYQGGQNLDRFGNEFSRVLGQEAARAKSGVFMEKNGVVLDMEDVKRLPNIADRLTGWTVLPPERQTQEREKAFMQRVEAEKERKASAQQQGVSTATTDATSVGTGQSRTDEIIQGLEEALKRKPTVQEVEATLRDPRNKLDPKFVEEAIQKFKGASTSTGTTAQPSGRTFYQRTGQLGNIEQKLVDGTNLTPQEQNRLIELYQLEKSDGSFKGTMRDYIQSIRANSKFKKQGSTSKEFMKVPGFKDIK